MSSAEQLNALIIDSRSGSRSRIREAIANTPLIENLTLSHGLRDALLHLEKLGMDYHIVFISSEFDISEMLNFVAKGKASTHGKNAAYVVVLKSRDQESNVMAHNLTNGVDGFLFEPFSVDQLQAIMELSHKIRVSNDDTRIKKSIEIVLFEAFRLVDGAAKRLKNGKDANAFRKVIKERQGLIADRWEKSPDLFTQVLLEMAERIKS